jgi:hypothetical protein
MLDGLHSCFLEQGDSRAKQLHGMLLEKASEPFLKMLSLWLFRCVIACLLAIVVFNLIGCRLPMSINVN